MANAKIYITNVIFTFLIFTKVWLVLSIVTHIQTHAEKWTSPIGIDEFFQICLKGYWDFWESTEAGNKQDLWALEFEYKDRLSELAFLI